MSKTWIGPDCTEGKHRACNAEAWNFDADEVTGCACACHAPAVPGLEQVELYGVPIRDVLAFETRDHGTSAGRHRAIWATFHVSPLRYENLLWHVVRAYTRQLLDLDPIAVRLIVERHERAAAARALLTRNRQHREA